MDLSPSCYLLCTDSQSDGGDDGSTGIIAGAVVGAFVLLICILLLILAVVLILRRRKKKAPGTIYIWVHNTYTKLPRGNDSFNYFHLSAGTPAYIQHVHC